MLELACNLSQLVLRSANALPPAVRICGRLGNCKQSTYFCRGGTLIQAVTCCGE